MVSPELELDTARRNNYASATASSRRSAEGFQSMGIASNSLVDMKVNQPIPPDRMIHSHLRSYGVSPEVDDVDSPRMSRSANLQSCNRRTPFPQTHIADATQPSSSDATIYPYGNVLFESAPIENRVRNTEHQIDSTTLRNLWDYGLNTHTSSVPQGPRDNRDSALSGLAVARGPRQVERTVFGADSGGVKPDCGVDPPTDIYIEGNALRANVTNPFNLDNLLDFHSWT